MAKQPEPLAVAPAMPATSIDFDAYHAAVTKGVAPDDVIAASALKPRAEAPEPTEPPVADDAA